MRKKNFVSGQLQTMIRWSVCLALCSSGAALSWGAATITTFDVPDAYGTYAYSINARGAIAGYYYDMGYMAHGFVRSPDGTIATFDVPGPPYTHTYAYSINDQGAITGYYSDPYWHGFVRSPDGTITTFDVPVPGVYITIPYSINGRGVITGYCDIYEGGVYRTLGFVRYPDGTFTTFGVPGAAATFGFDINARGAIAGTYTVVDSAGNQVGHGLLRSPNGIITSFDVPNAGGIDQYPCINDIGAIAGNYWTEVTPGGYLPGAYLRYPDGTFTTFDSSRYPTSINNRGTIVGYGAYGFLRTPDGTIININVGDTSTTPRSINDRGAITGDYWDGSVTHGFLRTP